MHERARVLIVDDDRAVLKASAEVLSRAGFEVLPIADGLEGLAAAKSPDVDVALLDVRMPHMSGMDLLKAIKEARPEVEVVMMTAFATVDTAVQAVKAGAYDYLTKPFENIDQLSTTIAKAAERKALRDRARNLEESLSAQTQFESLLGQSAAMRAVFKLVETVALSATTVLITGESGTGKELIARALHARSPRRDRPFVAVNCSALTETLLESELFGHIKGAFTGALRDTKGLFEAADGGTIFLDEIGDISQALQVRLLRVLQEGEMRRVGDNQNVRVDVRVIAATNADLAKARETGRFREDLYYRLNVIGIRLPPLRDRPDDVPLLAQFFLKRYADKLGKQVDGFSPETMEILACHSWPGNVRELENAVERAVVLAGQRFISPDDLPDSVRAASKRAGDVEVFSLAHLPYAEAKRLSLRAGERRYLSTLLRRSQGNVSSAARAAGMDRSNFRRLLRQHDVSNSGALDDEADEKPEGGEPSPEE